ncbi:MAG: galactose mutarotase [Planctomycetes bacterium]|nr:galactose mutarotase [Planctomycetota bacterium]
MSITSSFGGCLISSIVCLVGCDVEGTKAPTATTQQPASNTTAKSLDDSAPQQLPTKEKSGVTRETWGKADGQEVFLYTLTNKHGLEAKITNWGATVTELRVPDKDGKPDDIVLGFKTLDGYLKGDGKSSNPAYFGGIIGRYCNRIGNASFKLEGKEHSLAANNGKNHLHGGKKGWDKLVWKSEPAKAADGAAVRFTLTSPDGDEGYPGKVDAAVTYVLTDDNALRIEYEATTDKPTPLSLTNHSYFNLSGESSGSILDHEVELKSDRYAAFGDGGVPTGELKSVEGSPLDFRKATKVGQRIDQLKGEPGGYDHNYVLRDKKSDKPQPAASVYDPKSGRTLDIDTTEVGVQFYTGNYLDGSLASKSGTKYQQHAALCLEPQFFPDSPNKPDFPSPILKPGDTYRQVTVYRFGARKHVR